MSKCFECDGRCCKVWGAEGLMPSAHDLLKWRTEMPKMLEYIKDGELKEYEDDVVLDKVVERLGKGLIEEKEKLESEITKNQKHIQSLQAIIDKWDDLRQVKQRIRALGSKIADITAEIRDIEREFSFSTQGRAN